MRLSRKISLRYPIGTLMPYEPDNTRATKLVAAVFNRPGQKPDALHRWFVDTGDARNEPAIAGEVAAFFKQHGVEETTVSDRIMGCPHEEGVDYPMGRPCPHCQRTRHESPNEFDERPVRQKPRPVALATHDIPSEASVVKKLSRP
jgi:hypothetical protein